LSRLFRKSYYRKPGFFKLIKLLLIGFFIYVIILVLLQVNSLPVSQYFSSLQSNDSQVIKWVDFNVPYKALEKAMYADIESYQDEIHLNWIDILAYLGVKYGGNFKHYKAKDMDNLIEKLKQGESIEDLTKDMKSFDYYQKAYSAVLAGFLGEFKIQVPVEKDPDIEDPDSVVIWQTKYGLKAFSPIAAGYWYNHYDDFGAGRSYGYRRKHFGHDLMVSTGAPIIAVESGIVEAMGWNQYGGWRIGIRSYDKLRYYYYAHLRKDHPYAANLYIGKAVKAGDVIGYSGRTGYSVKENVNNIDTPHLHYGMQLIFDESLKDSPNQIWIDLYDITKLLSKNKSVVYKDEESKEYFRKYEFSEPSYFQKEDDGKAEALDLHIIDSRGK
jgi:murein DD-endopeptidase MepM/ murein hydrolase activator NlpD